MTTLRTPKPSVPRSSGRSTSLPSTPAAKPAEQKPSILPGFLNFTDVLTGASRVLTDGQENFARMMINDEHTRASPQTASGFKPSGRVVARLGGRTYGDDPRTMRTTGGGVDFSIGRAEGRYGVGHTVNLRTGQANVGVSAGVQADAVNVTARAQVGEQNSVAGAGYTEGTARVGASANVNTGVQVNPRQGTAVVKAGGEVFAGAEVVGRVGYGNRYGGASVEGRAQAGIGGSAGVQAGFENGKLMAKVDLGAVLGVGGRVRVDVNLNIGAVAEDTLKAVSNPGAAFNALCKGFSG